MNIKSFLGLSILLLLILISCSTDKQKTNQGTEGWLKGKVILKDLIHPVQETVLKNCLVLQLDETKTFELLQYTNTDKVKITANEIRIYGNLENEEPPEQRFSHLIDKKVIIKAEVEYAPSGNYPLLVNIIDDFEYKIIE